MNFRPRRPLVMMGLMTFCFVGCIAATIWRGVDRMDIFSWCLILAVTVPFFMTLHEAIQEIRR